MKVTVVIPVRYGSSRFPGKPLALINGKPMIQHVVERASKATLIDEVFVATDDSRIEAAVKGFGGTVIQTKPEHRSGSDRVAEVALNLSSEIFINVQGDQPNIESSLIDQVASSLINEKKVMMSTAAIDFESKEDFLNPNMVKVLCDKDRFALYFSRTPIPFRNRAWKETQNWSDLLGSYKLSDIRSTGVQKHLGIYGYKREVLKGYASWATSALEKEEDLEQLRALENNVRIKVVKADHESISIDTPEDLEKLGPG